MVDEDVEEKGRVLPGEVRGKQPLVIQLLLPVFLCFYTGQMRINADWMVSEV